MKILSPSSPQSVENESLESIWPASGRGGLADHAQGSHPSQGASGVGNGAALEMLATRGAGESGTSSDMSDLPFQDEMQSWFGASFSDLAVRRGEHPPLNGKCAATDGETIWFESPFPDRETVKHELAHVVQLRLGRGEPPRTPSDRVEAEREAHQVEQGSASQGAVVATLGAAPPGLYGKDQTPESTAEVCSVLPTIEDNPQAFGQATQGQTRTLICDLTSPLVVGSNPHYCLVQTGDEISALGSKTTYRWSVSSFGDGTSQSQIGQAPDLVIPCETPGKYRVAVEVLCDGELTGMVFVLDQEVVAEDSTLTKSLANMDSDAAATYRELVNDFGQYIRSAAEATGPFGVSARFVAAILMIEVSNRPKDGRDSELKSVKENLYEEEDGGITWPWEKINRSLGVGQIRMSTAAMLVGATPWVDQDRDSRSDGVEKTDAAFDSLPPGVKENILTLLQYPKSNITLVATLLAHLKNRTNRYPTLGREAFSKDKQAVGVVATEYNAGPTNSPASEAGYDTQGYGEWAWDFMADPILSTFFEAT